MSSPLKTKPHRIVHLVKIQFALLCALSWQTLLFAQAGPGAEVDKTEIMLRKLREALTNPPATTPEAQPARSPADIQRPRHNRSRSRSRHNEHPSCRPGNRPGFSASAERQSSSGDARRPAPGVPSPAVPMPLPARTRGTNAPQTPPLPHRALSPLAGEIWPRHSPI